MLNVFALEELQIQLSDGRLMSAKDLVMDYERLLKEEVLKKVTTTQPKADTPSISKLKVGEWFRIDREIIEKSKEEIRRKCNEAGIEGKKLWKRLEASNKIANKNPNQFPNLIETYIFEHTGEYMTVQEMLNMCDDVGDGMCCEIICDLELQMRIYNGEAVNDLLNKADRLPYPRIIKFRDGSMGCFGGGANVFDCDTPVDRYKFSFSSKRKYCRYTPYAFRRVFSQS